MTHARFLAVGVAVVGSVLMAGGARAAAAEGQTDNGLSGRVLFGGVAIPEFGVTSELMGVGIAYERDFLDNAIAVEICAELMASPEAIIAPLELVVEKPFEMSEHWGLYAGLGPIVSPHYILGKELTFGAGGIGVFGAEVEIREHMEWFIELDAAVLYFEVPVLEADVGTGILYRF